jgi:hypothetical protein
VGKKEVINVEEKPQNAEKETKVDQKLEITLELLKEEINALKERGNATEERISRENESIGEIKEMSMNTEKESKELSIKAEQAISIIKETKPEEIYGRLEKFDQKLEKQKEVLGQFKSMITALEERQKEITSKMAIIKGAETLMKLNDEIRDELMNVKKVEAKIERDADRVESIYLTYQKEFSDLSDIKSRGESIEKLQKEMVKEIDDTKVRMQSLAEKKKLESFRTDLDKVIVRLDSMQKISDTIKKSGEKVEHLITGFETEYDDPQVLKQKIEEFDRRIRKLEPVQHEKLFPPQEQPAPAAAESTPEQPVAQPQLTPAYAAMIEAQTVPDTLGLNWRLTPPKHTSIFDDVRAEKHGEFPSQKEKTDEFGIHRLEIENSLSLIGDGKSKTVYPFLLKIERALYSLKQNNALSKNMVLIVLANLQRLREVYGPNSVISAEITGSMNRIRNII